MSDLRKWRVTGPDGFERVANGEDESEAIENIFHLINAARSKSTPSFNGAINKLMQQAGYRAEPIEPEPKMVTVMADDVNTIISMPGLGWAEAVTRLRAALEDAK